MPARTGSLRYGRTTLRRSNPPPHAPIPDTVRMRSAHSSVTPGPLRQLLRTWLVHRSRRSPASPAVGPPVAGERRVRSGTRTSSAGPTAARLARAAARRAALRRAGAAGRRGPRACCGGSAAHGRPVALTGRPDAAAGGRGQRRGAAGAAGLAGVGRDRPRSDRHRRGRPDHAPRLPPGLARDRLAGGRRLAAAPRAGARGGAVAADAVGAAGAVGAPPISYGWWTRRRRSATGPGCCVRDAPRPSALSRWPSRRPRGWAREHGRGR